MNSTRRSTRPHYDDVTAEVVAFLGDRVERAVAAGIPLERLIVDPGHDLNKNTWHSLELTRRLKEIVAIGLPTLVAVSNKDFIGETLDRGKSERLEGSLAAAVICIMKDARIVRMHDVAPTLGALHHVLVSDSSLLLKYRRTSAESSSAEGARAA